MEVRETKEARLPDRRVTIHRVADPGLPELPELQELSAEEIEAVRNSPAVRQWREQAAETTHLFISATVVDCRATLLHWWHEGTKYRAWSNIDWMILAGSTEFRKGDKRFVSLLMAGRMNSANLPADSPSRIPDDLPAEPGTYHVTQGDPTDAEACEGVIALHELYRSDHTRLKRAYDLREQRRKEREAARRADRSKPDDIVLHYWRAEPDREQPAPTKGGAR